MEASINQGHEALHSEQNTYTAVAALSKCC